MRRPRIVLAVGAVIAGVCVALVLSAPPPAQLLDPADWTPTPPWVAVRGSFHVHTTASDGSGSIDEVASAASAAGLAFVIVTDHGDGVALREPTYRSGVLMIDAVEISSRDGHVLALGAQEAPYPLGGDGRDIVEDLERLGGMTVAAHPDSPKMELAWQDPRVSPDAIEWVNLDSEWRRTSWWRAAVAVLAYPRRPAEAVASLIARPAETLARWDEHLLNEPVVALPGADAHGHLGLFDTPDPVPNALFNLPLPSYEAVFDALTLHAVLDAPLSGDPAADRDAILGALAAGRVFTAVEGLAAPARFEFLARGAEGIVPMGGTIAPAPDVELTVRTVAPEGAEVVVLRNGVEVARGVEPQTTLAAPEPGVYRVEVRWAPETGASPVPWILSNPIRVAAPVRAPAPAPPAPSRPADTEPAMRLYPRGGAGAWTLEQDDFSRAAIDEIETDQGTALAYRFALAADTDQPPWTALVRQLPPSLPETAILRFEGRADRPMRVSVQLRADGRRWRRSVYFDPFVRDVALPLAEFRPVDAASAAVPVVEASSLLFVVDTVNTAPGTAGIVLLGAVHLRAAP